MAKMRVIRSIAATLTTAGAFAAFLWRRKVWWMIPMAAVLLAFAAVIAAGGPPNSGPFVYTLF